MTTIERKERPADLDSRREEARSQPPQKKRQSWGNDDHQKRTKKRRPHNRRHRGGSVLAALFAPDARDAGAELDGGALAAGAALGRGGRLAQFDELGRHRQEGLLDVGRVLGRGLQELDPERVGVRLGGFRRDGLVVLHVGLVADEQFARAVRRVAIHLRQPIGDVLKGFLARHVVHHDDAVGAAVVGRRDGPEALLAGGVPDLQLDRLAVDLDRAKPKVDADRRDVRLGERVVGEPQQQTRLADARVADEHQLEQVVVVALRRHWWWSDETSRHTPCPSSSSSPRVSARHGWQPRAPPHRKISLPGGLVAANSPKNSQSHCRGAQ
mmetsp:Transcript_12018/g.48380  ORF Transcript_12018/g.48380 Transcript_12018/m.48380 type:complete len:326 (-) Transcript_12018:171-1148(-)